MDAKRLADIESGAHMYGENAAAVVLEMAAELRAVDLEWLERVRMAADATAVEDVAQAIRDGEGDPEVPGPYEAAREARRLLKVGTHDWNAGGALERLGGEAAVRFYRGAVERELRAIVARGKNAMPACDHRHRDDDDPADWPACSGAVERMAWPGEVFLCAAHKAYSERTGQ